MRFRENDSDSIIPNNALDAFIGRDEDIGQQLNFFQEFVLPYLSAFQVPEEVFLHTASS